MNVIKNSICVLVLLVMPIFSLNPTFASTTQDLNQQKNYYEKQAQDAKKQTQQKQLEANSLQSEINKVDKNISNVSNALALTNDEIQKNETASNTISLQIWEKEQELIVEEEKLKAVIANQYMRGEDGLLTTIISSNSISEVANRYEAYEAVQNQLKFSADTVKSLRDDLIKQKDQLEQKKSELQGLKDSQSAQQQDLEEQKDLKNQLLNNTQNTISSLQNQAKNAQAKIAEIDQKIRALSGTKNWGSQIVSSNDNSWYYTQTGNFTKLGTSPYTVDQYGCLITSMAMVATYYGQRISPTDIAQIKGIFNSGGYLLVSSPPGLGVSILPSRSIDWNTVDQEIANDRPVIVSIYLPSVGKINEDGSSHFVVIKGKSGDKYLMHDPIGDGRSYNLSQVRSMKLVRNN